MNLLKRYILLKKLYRSIHKRCITLSTPSVLQIENNKARMEDTLRERYRKFLEQTMNENDKTKYNVDVSTCNPKIDDVPRVSEVSNPLSETNVLSEYERLVVLIENVPNNRYRRNIIRNIDEKICRLLVVLSKTQILNLLHALSKKGIEISHLKLYRSSLLALRKYLERDTLSVNEKLQLVFFEGLGKKKSKNHVEFLMNYLPPPSDLTVMEKCIVAHASFKCTARLDAPVVRSFEETIENSASELVKDPSLLITICKTIIQNGPSKEFSLENLSRALNRYDEVLSLTRTAYILSLYREANQNDPILTKKLVNNSMMEISECRKNDRLRPTRIKDVHRLLWSSFYLNCQLEEWHKKEMIMFLRTRYKDLEQEPFLLIRILLALWILNCRPYDIIDKCVKNNIFHSVNKQYEAWKPIARLHLLLNCIKLESSEITLSDEYFKLFDVGLKISISVKKIWRIVDELGKKFNLPKATIDCPVDEIYIPGVSLRIKGKLIHIDLLDDLTCFKGTHEPHGLMNLKLRLLKKSGIKCITITEKQLTDTLSVASSLEKFIKQEFAIEENA